MGGTDTGFFDVMSDDTDPWSGVDLIWSGFLTKLPGLLGHELSVNGLGIRNGGPLGRTLITTTHGRLSVGFA